MNRLPSLLPLNDKYGFVVFTEAIVCKEDISNGLDGVNAHVNYAFYSHNAMHCFKQEFHFSAKCKDIRVFLDSPSGATR